MKRFVAVLCLAGLLPFTCNGETWKEIGHDDLSVTSVDLDSIKASGGVLEVWTLWNYNKPQSVGNGPSFSSIKSKALVKCASHETADADYTIYSLRDGRGDVIFQSVNDTKFAPAGVDSKSAVVVAFVCGIHINGRSESGVQQTEKSAKTD